MKKKQSIKAVKGWGFLSEVTEGELISNNGQFMLYETKAQAVKEMNKAWEFNPLKPILVIITPLKKKK